MDFENFRDSYPLPPDRAVFGVAAVAAVAPVTLSRPPVTFDGFQWLNLNPSRNRVLLTNQPNPRDNGIYEARPTTGSVNGFNVANPNTTAIISGLTNGALYYVETINCEARGMAIDPDQSFLLQAVVDRNSTGFVIAGSPGSIEVTTQATGGSIIYRPASLFRVADADDDLDFFLGKRVAVRLGANVGGTWTVSRLGSTRPITLGSEIRFTRQVLASYRDPNFDNRPPHPNQSFENFDNRAPVLVTPDFLRLPDSEPLAIVEDGRTQPLTCF